jgi:26S proteasome regulatory subunit T3
LHAVRDNRYIVLNKDLEKAYKNNCKKSDTEFEFYQ